MQAAGKETMGWNWFRERAFVMVRRRKVERRVRTVEEAISARGRAGCGEGVCGEGGKGRMEVVRLPLALRLALILLFCYKDAGSLQRWRRVRLENCTANRFRTREIESIRGRSRGRSRS